MAGGWFRRFEQGMILGQRGAGGNLCCVCRRGAEGADWWRVAGRNSSLGEKRCSGAQDVSSGLKTSLIWQQQRRYSYRKQGQGG